MFGLSRKSSTSAFHDGKGKEYSNFPACLVATLNRATKQDHLGHFSFEQGSEELNNHSPTRELKGDSDPRGG